MGQLNIGFEQGRNLKFYNDGVVYAVTFAYLIYTKCKVNLNLSVILHPRDRLIR